MYLIASISVSAILVARNV